MKIQKLDLYLKVTLALSLILLLNIVSEFKNELDYLLVVYT